MNYRERNALREHAEAHYGEHHMTRMDWVKAVGGALIMAPIMYACVVILMLM